MPNARITHFHICGCGCKALSTFVSFSPMPQRGTPECEAAVKATVAEIEALYCEYPLNRGYPCLISIEQAEAGPDGKPIFHTLTSIDYVDAGQRGTPN